MNTIILKYRRVLAIALHLAIIVVASYTAFLLRFDGAIPPTYIRVFWQALPWLVLARMAMFAPFRLYEGLWRYSGIWDLRNIIIAVAASSGLFYQIALWRLPEPTYPRSILFIDSVLVIVAMGGARLSRRLAHELSRAAGSRRILIVGAGDAGERIVRDMLRDRDGQYEPVGYIDDSPAKVGVRIHGVPVLGTRAALPKVMEQVKPNEVVFAIPSASGQVVADVFRALEPYRVPMKTLPGIRQIRQGSGLVSQIRNLNIEDLLQRAPIGLETEPLERLIKGRRVLVTGAGGSIGSELCCQIAKLQPATLVMLDRYENGLFAVTNRLAGENGHCPVHSVIADVADRARVDAIMAMHRPEIVFHAAAHKHVPLMEANPCEAVKNNVFGTRSVMDAAAQHGVECFVLISTDKAVNPTSVMGTTKRVAELLVQSTQSRGRTRYVAVRFGNVLASNGSVVPTFMDQIKAGGPVTVTHPEIRRFFMLIPEAVQLVLQAAALADAGSVYVLEMGDQLKLVDMARNLIRLSGFVPDIEIPIVFTGLRPGEKLFEELVGDDERAEGSGVEKIRRVHPMVSPVDLVYLTGQILKLERLAFAGDVAGTLQQLRHVVPTSATTHLAPSEPVALVS